LVFLSRQVCSLGSRQVILDLTTQNLIKILIIWLRDVVEVILMVCMMHGKPSLIFKSPTWRWLRVVLVLVERVSHVLIFFWSTWHLGKIILVLTLKKIQAILGVAQ
jgi:hypothetical protein